MHALRQMQKTPDNSPKNITIPLDMAHKPVKTVTIETESKIIVTKSGIKSGRSDQKYIDIYISVRFTAFK